MASLERTSVLDTTPALKRTITLTPLIFYGVGTMVGGGFYALLGQVVGITGTLAPVSLAVAGLLALLSAASFAELSSRFPVSAGEVEYVWRGFHTAALARLVGWLVITTGIVSAATLAVATVGFAQDLVRLPENISVVVLVVSLGLLASWGISESVGAVFGITVIEVGTLIVVGTLAGDSLATIPTRWPELVPPLQADQWTAILSGATLAFYAFIGFEDMVNIAEEVHRPRRNLPVAILVSVGVTTFLYIWIGLVASLSVAPDDLSGNTPVARLVSDRGPQLVTSIGLVSILTGVNGALVQIIMSARVAYGMARRGWAHTSFGRINPTTRTPVTGTVVMTGVIVALALVFPLVTLARATSAIMLVNFSLVNLALWRLKGTTLDTVDEGPCFPRWLPLVAATSCIGLLLFQALSMFSR